MCGLASSKSKSRLNYNEERENLIKSFAKNQLFDMCVYTKIQKIMNKISKLGRYSAKIKLNSSLPLNKKNVHKQVGTPTTIALKLPSQPDCFFLFKGRD